MEKRPERRAAGRGLTERREEILDAATELFAEGGYSDAVTQRLAERLGVGKGTLYRHFPSKRDLFLAAVDRVLCRLRDRLDASLLTTDDPLEGVAQAVRAYLGFFAEHPKFVELLILERALFKDREKPTFLEHRERNLWRWRERYRSLIAEGRVRDVPVERITDVIGHLLYGTIFTNYFAGRNEPAEAQARDVLDVVFLGILSEPERAARGAGRPARGAEPGVSRPPGGRVES